MDGEGDVDSDLRECKTCGRRFRSDVLNKHEPICLKNAKKKRKVFDSGKQRAEGSDVPINKTMKPGQIPKPDPKAAAAEARTKQWRQRHETLVESLRAARQYTKAKESGGPLPPPPPAAIDPSLVQCPHCQRRFNENACERHIPFCKEQQTRVNPKLGMNQKNTYKAPLPKKKPPITTQPPPQRSAGPAGAGGRARESPSVNQMQSNSNNRQTRITPPSVTGSNVRNGSTSTTAARTIRPPGGVSSKPSATVGPQPRTGTTPVGSRPRGSIPSSQLPRGSQTGRKLVAPVTTAAASTAVFCHECGSSFGIASARFCSECGVRRLAI